VTYLIELFARYNIKVKLFADDVKPWAKTDHCCNIGLSFLLQQRAVKEMSKQVVFDPGFILSNEFLVSDAPHKHVS